MPRKPGDEATSAPSMAGTVGSCRRAEPLRAFADVIEAESGQLSDEELAKARGWLRSPTQEAAATTI
jgi:hypothetical protein